MAELKIPEELMDVIHEYDKKRLEWLFDDNRGKREELENELRVLEQLIAISIVLGVKNQIIQ